MAFTTPDAVFANVGKVYPGPFVAAQSFDEVGAPLGLPLPYTIRELWVNPGKVADHDTPGGIPVQTDAALTTDQIRFRLTRDSGPGALDEEWELEAYEVLWFEGFTEPLAPPGGGGGR